MPNHGRACRRWRDGRPEPTVVRPYGEEVVLLLLVGSLVATTESSAFSRLTTTHTRGRGQNNTVVLCVSEMATLGAGDDPRDAKLSVVTPAQLNRCLKVGRGLHRHMT